MLRGAGALFEAVTEVLIDVAPVLESPLPDGFTDAVQQLAHEVVNGPVTDCVVHHPNGPAFGPAEFDCLQVLPFGERVASLLASVDAPPVGIVRTCQRPAVIASSWTF
jgi:hypothetical protein